MYDLPQNLDGMYFVYRKTFNNNQRNMNNICCC